jgi:hypothetical protein
MTKSRGSARFIIVAEESLAAAEAKLTTALSSVPDYARAHLALGVIHICTRRARQGIAECGHALELNRNLANAHSFIGYGKIPIGRAEETKDHSARAYASARAIWRLTLGWISRVSRSSMSAVTSKRSRGFNSRLRPTEITR